MMANSIETRLKKIEDKLIEIVVVIDVGVGIVDLAPQLPLLALLLATSSF
jgi:hypothetical protein